ncbi:GapA-binding peptide SR1P [Niallia oryzisoli]|uniref:GapA-binding peptide SR1P n=1 Tax=Niallia oryzisoli TaxID=1737571 RepID=A0ABZ2CA23_9BACI
MSDQAVVKQGTIICQECGKEIDAVENTNGVKTWYGICRDCADIKEKE